MGFSFDPVKNAWLIRHRGIGFERIISLIEEGKLIQVLEHPNQEPIPKPGSVRGGRGRLCVYRARGQGGRNPVSQDDLSEPKSDQETH